jgi:DNA-binding transcriptional regulator YiaG
MEEKLFEELLESVKEAGQILKGKRQPARTFALHALDVRSIRESLSLSQQQFAALVHVSVKTLRNWEQGIRRPGGAAAALLTAIRNSGSSITGLTAMGFFGAGAVLGRTFPRKRHYVKYRYSIPSRLTIIHQEIYMKLSVLAVLCFVVFNTVLLADDWPMSNDPKFDSSVENPMYENSKGPTILLDAAHHNFHVTEGFITPFAELAASDGYQTIKGSSEFTPEFLRSFDIVMVITALPFEFTSKTEVTTETTFTRSEIEALYDWVSSGGSLLVFSEHAPFDQAINPLLSRFGVSSSVGTIADPVHYDKKLKREGWVVFSRENGLLNTDHPIVNGRDESETVNSVVSFGGSALTGDDFINIFRLSDTAENRQHPTGVGPDGMGVSQALAGEVGEGRILIFGDSNGFTAMNFDQEDGSVKSLGMNTEHHDWKQMVLNSLHWLSGDL